MTAKNTQNENIKTIKLKRPIHREGGDITELKLREPRTTDLEGVAFIFLAQGDTAHVRKVAMRTISPAITQHEYDRLPLADVGAITMEVIDFLNASDEEVTEKI